MSTQCTALAGARLCSQTGFLPAHGSFKDECEAFLAKALTAERLHVTITGTSKANKPFNVKLMGKRVNSIRKSIEQVVKDIEIDPERVQIEEIEFVKD